MEFFVLFIAVFLFFGGFNSFGAVKFFATTHQEILKRAYVLLKKDPAFLGSNFSTLDEILEKEGVTPVFCREFPGITILGAGPDTEGMTPESAHYYNPIIKEGLAPYYAARYFLKALVSDNKIDKAWGLAWSAHFVSDMCVPYHIVGVPREKWQRILYLKQGILDAKVAKKGFTEFIRKNFFKPKTVRQKIYDLFVNFFASDSKGCWFDPWYKDRDEDFFSHVSWENFAHFAWMESRYYSKDKPYNPGFKNGSPSFRRPYAKQRRLIRKFTVGIAGNTNVEMKNFLVDPRLAIQEAIWNVVTLWRASISGLRIRVLEKKAGYISFFISNFASETANNVSVRMTTKQGARRKKVKNVGNIKSGESRVVDFSLRVKRRKKLTLRIEATAKYSVPDLQYVKKISS